LKKIGKLKENCFSQFRELIIKDPDYRILAGQYFTENEFCELWFYQKRLLRLLRLEKSDFIGNEIGTYRSVKAFESFLPSNKPENKTEALSEADAQADGDGVIGDGDGVTKRKNPDETNKKEEKCFCLYDITDMNDAQEGLALQEYFDVAYPAQGKLVPLQASFTMNSDSLTMFRLYGCKKNKKEETRHNPEQGTGISLVFDERFFHKVATDIHLLRTVPQTKKNLEKSWKVFQSYSPLFDRDTVLTKSGENKYLPLYYVLYYDEENKTFLYHPSMLENRIENGKLWSDSDRRFDEKQTFVQKKARAIAEVLEKMKKTFESLRQTDPETAKANEQRLENSEGGYKKRNPLMEKSKAALNLLIYVRYLIKKSDSLTKKKFAC
jgi:hypothetical protein